MNLVDTFSEFKDMKSIDRPTMVRVLEDVFRTLIRKKYGDDENFDVIVNTDKGDLEIWRVREIVADDDVEEERTQVGISEALKIEADYEIGEECYEKVELIDFGRRAIQAARQTLISRIMELEKDDVYRKYSERVGEIVLGEVHQILKREILVLDDQTGNELVLPRTETIKGDFFKKGEMVRAVIKQVELKNNTPRVILSRTDGLFLEKLLEQEVPEIEDGLITIQRVVRNPGLRAKIAVESYDERIDPVGACVGVKGGRIHGIVRELRNENIDIINFTTNDSLLISRALTPATVTRVEVDTENRRAAVYLEADQVSSAIGKNGINIKLASALTGFEIDVFRNSDTTESDIDLDEFRDEIEDWMIDELKRVGCDTAKSVLQLQPEFLIRRTELEEEMVYEIMQILRAEFEGED
jgi:transcription termination/antitermination protein NusA